MVQDIEWTETALDSYRKNIDYLYAEWTQKEIDKFTSAVSRKIALLSLQPRIGTPTNKRLWIRKTVINKQIVLFYRFKPRKRIVELVLFFNTHRSPLV